VKVLFSTTSGAGHYRPLFPIASALVRSGHEVLFACPETSAGAISEAGFGARAFDEAEPTDEQRALFEQAAATGDPSLGEKAVGIGFGYVSPRAALPRLETVMGEGSFDLVVRDPGEMASLVICERDGLPSVIGMGGLQSAFGLLGGLVAEPLSRLRTLVGVPDPGTMATDALILTPTPESFDEPSDLPTEVLRYGLGTPLRDVPPDGPVYATLGTEVMSFFGGPRLLRTILEALADLELAAVVTTGVDPAEIGLPATPPSIEVRKFVSHSQVIPSSRAVITHGGAGTVQDAIVMGRPMVVLPQFADQPANGRRVEEVGIGRVLGVDEQTVDNLRSAVRDVLSGGYDRSSKALAEEAAGLPPIDSLVERLELVAGR